MAATNGRMSAPTKDYAAELADAQAARLAREADDLVRRGAGGIEDLTAANAKATLALAAEIRALRIALVGSEPPAAGWLSRLLRAVTK